jgi:energy-coupling factor transporter ATP-binding protein EcfA2
MSTEAQTLDPESATVSAGAKFVRADLHVHTYPDSDAAPDPDLEQYIDSAVDNGIDVLAITDHNTAAFAKAAVRAAEGKPLLVLPGVEISTHDGHLLALFAPEKIGELDALAHASNLKLQDLSETEKRSTRSVLDLVEEIDRRGGLAIPAHVDVANGICAKLRQVELVELLTNPALAGLEFAKHEALSEWFTPNDPDPDRLAAWKARQKIPELAERGLARLMSSDAHAPDKVGRDRASRTLTRLRLDDPNFSAIRNAILLNPKARCKAEAILPATYPRIMSAQFEGGFLDGVSLDFSDNLNCLIGGRGSGKSTALLSIRAALGATTGPDEDPDDTERMPSVTTVRFIDSTGSERVATRHRGQAPVDESGAPVRLRLADLGQDESGRLARGYDDDPELLLNFLDGFIVRHSFEEQETDLLAQLADNGAEITKTNTARRQIEEFEREEARLAASLKAAEDGKVEQIAQWAGLLAAQGPLLVELGAMIDRAAALPADATTTDLDALAADFGVDLTSAPAANFVNGDDGLRQRLIVFETRRKTIAKQASVDTAAAAAEVRARLDAWKAEQADLEKRLGKRQTELEAQGLKVQAGAVREMAKRLNTVKTSLIGLRQKQKEHEAARTTRQGLVAALHENRQKLFATRKATLRRIVDAANAYSEELIISVYYEQSGIDGLWVKWLTEKCGFRQPRVARLARMIRPHEFAAHWLNNPSALLALADDDGAKFFQSEEALPERRWQTFFELETMELRDRPRIEVHRSGSGERKPFDHLSAGQQRSVLLSLLLCAERSEPLVLDQPEDHLDGQYIARAVVRHLEAAKERRQILIATHSANLTVLGDAELVIPMKVEDGTGRPYAIGAVDRPETRDEVCALLEGGTQAYKKRGDRYGFRFAEVPE